MRWETVSNSVADTISLISIPKAHFMWYHYLFQTMTATLELGLSMTGNRESLIAKPKKRSMYSQFMTSFSQISQFWIYLELVRRTCYNPTFGEYSTSVLNVFLCYWD